MIPTLYGREEDTLFLHGAVASRLMKQMATGTPVCITVTHVDGLVLARSAFHHSMNYRSVVLFGTAVAVDAEDKEHALFVLSEQVIPGRWAEVRGPAPKELAATSVAKFTIETASAKIRTGPPVDEDEDYELPIWAGVVPMNHSYQAPIADERLLPTIELPPSLRKLASSQR